MREGASAVSSLLATLNVQIGVTKSRLLAVECGKCGYDLMTDATFVTSIEGPELAELLADHVPDCEPGGSNGLG
jgi:hypothetical protein